MMEGKEILLMQNEDGTWSEKPEPYAVVECPREEDFKDFEKALEIKRNLTGVMKAIDNRYMEMVDGKRKCSVADLFEFVMKNLHDLNK